MEYYNDIDNSKLLKAKNIRAILISLKNILTTYKGSILFNREFGFNLEELLFLPNNKVSENYIQIELEREIEKYIDLDDIQIDYLFSYNVLDRKFNITLNISEKGDTSHIQTLTL